MGPDTKQEAIKATAHLIATLMQTHSQNNLPSDAAQAGEWIAKAFETAYPRVVAAIK